MKKERKTVRNKNRENGRKIREDRNDWRKWTNKYINGKKVRMKERTECRKRRKERWTNKLKIDKEEFRDVKKREQSRIVGK